MYKVNPVYKKNQEIHKLLNNGLVFTLVGKSGNVLKSACYAYQLEVIRKCNRGSKVIKTCELLEGES